jgi:hypothetical protein
VALRHPVLTRHEVSARVPDDSDTFAFGVFLAGSGRIEICNAELIREP